MSTAKKRSVGGRVKSSLGEKQKETGSSEAGDELPGPSSESTPGEKGTEGKSVGKKGYGEFIRYKFVGNSKMGICKLCEEKNFNVEIKMEKSNTSGIRRHLERKHKVTINYFRIRELRMHHKKHWKKCSVSRRIIRLVD